MMKAFLTRLLWGTLVGALLVAPAFAIAQSSSEEKIDGFYVSATINQDATVKVAEKIVYNFGDNERHGIFRTIPIKYSNTLGNLKIKITDITVTDENFKEYEFDVSTKGRNLEIKIGNAAAYVRGIKTYVITYTVDRSMSYFEDFDEWYWNLTGNEWNVPIGEIEAMIHFPQGIAGNELKVSCYIGSAGSNQSCGTITSTSTQSVQSVSFKAPRGLQPFEGLTAAVGFPKGIVHEPTQQEKITDLIKDNAILILPVLVFLFMFRLWWQKGKDPAGRGTIVPEYESPEKLSPMEMSLMLNQSVRDKDISAHIIYLAEKGFIKITQTGEKKFLKDTTDYILTKTKNISEAENEVDKKLLTALFHDDTGNEKANERKLSDLKHEFYKELTNIKRSVITSVITKGYYTEDPLKTIFKYIGLGVVFEIAAFLIALALGYTGVLLIVSIALSGACIIIFALLMPRVTSSGAVIKERIEGLKRYITVAEKDRINFHNAPEKKPELFEKLLPFAMVLGVEKAWADQFKDMYLTEPSWYHGTHPGAFNAVIFANSLSSFNSVAATNLASAPGGGSGSGGGGFSGGGFGGGGGGSW
jgi:uncharacterized membrane protein